MKAIADTMGVARSHLMERMKPQEKSFRCRYNKADDAWLLPLIRELVDAGQLTDTEGFVLFLTANWKEWASLLSTTSESTASCVRMACC